MELHKKIFFISFIIVYGLVSLILMACVWEAREGDTIGQIALMICVVCMYFWACVGIKHSR